MTIVDSTPRFDRTFQQRAIRLAPNESFGVLVLLLLSAIFVFAMALDTRLINGINPWIKPLKFSISLTLYLATFAFFAHLLPSGLYDKAWFRRYLGLVFLCILLEMLWIGGAAFLGTTSHFNVSTPFAALLYGLMGAAAVTLTTAALVWGVAIWRTHQAAFARLVGASFVLTFVLTVPIAGYMSATPGHFVGEVASDAGGLWLLGWSREVGDLRVAHFFATHAMQIIPAAYAVLLWIVGARLPKGVGAVLCVAFAMLTVATFVEALAGRPFLSML